MSQNKIKPEYILATGAPGSRWSGVVKGIYYSPDINQSDYKEENIFYFKKEDEEEGKKPNHFATYFVYKKHISVIAPTVLVSITDLNCL